MNKKQQNIIMKKLRDLSKMYSVRNDAKKRQKRGPATFECACCGLWLYEGKKSLEKALESLELPENTKIEAGKGQMDHKEPIGTFIDWNSYMDKLFCDIDGWQYICEVCHSTKSASEAGERADEKRVDKKKKK